VDFATTTSIPNRTLGFSFPATYDEASNIYQVLGLGWDPKVSTLLQVLVSIQSLILCEEPFYNEPAFDKMARHSVQSQIYNSNTRFETMRVAMLPVLRRISSGGGRGSGGGGGGGGGRGGIHGHLTMGT
jgi:hypothetical protein